MPEFPFFVLAGFLAQVVDGAMGMAYGVTAATLLLSQGIPPAVTSATVHAAECFSTGASATSHYRAGNVDGFLFRRILLPGITGAVLGAYLLTSLPGDALKPWIAGYLFLMGILILVRAFRTPPQRNVKTHLRPLGFLGGLIDAIGGGGWGPIVTSTLLVRGNHIRKTIGSVNSAEFFVTTAASVTFFLAIGLNHWPVILGLALGGLIAAPLGAWLCKRLPVKPFMGFTGLLIVTLSLRTLWKILA